MFQAIGELMIEHEGATLEGLKQHVGHAPMLRQRDGSTGVVRGRARGRAGCSHDLKSSRREATQQGASKSYDSDYWKSGWRRLTVTWGEWHVLRAHAASVLVAWR